MLARLFLWGKILPPPKEDPAHWIGDGRRREDFHPIPRKKGEHPGRQRSRQGEGGLPGKPPGANGITEECSGDH